MVTVIVWKLKRDGQVAIYRNLTEAEADAVVESAVELLEKAGIKDPMMYIAEVES